MLDIRIGKSRGAHFAATPGPAQESEKDKKVLIEKNAFLHVIRSTIIVILNK